MAFYRSHILVCVDPNCISKGAYEIMDALQDDLVACIRCGNCLQVCNFNAVKVVS